MIMIIYERNLHIPEWPKNKTCIKCKSVLGVEEKDIIVINNFDQREGSYNSTGFKYPVCEKKNSRFINKGSLRLLIQTLTHSGKFSNYQTQ